MYLDACIKPFFGYLWICMNVFNPFWILMLGFFIDIFGCIKPFLNINAWMVYGYIWM